MNNTVHQEYRITKSERQKRHKHNSFLIWFTGLSGSGKSTLANLVEVELHNLDISTYTLDGDNIRRGINKNLGFTAADRTENIRRIAEISNLFVEAGVVVLGAFVSPYIKDRENIKNTVGAENFIEIFVNTSLAECERRDVKGLYEKARAGEIQNMTGVTDPYEAPIKADLEIITDNEAIEISLQKIMDFITLKIKRNNE
jgi:adenylylsulfate kinase